LCDTELDVGEDEVLVKVNGFLVVLGRFTKFLADEVELRAVVVDIWVFGILIQC